VIDRSDAFVTEELHNAERVGAYHMPRDRLTDLKIVRQVWQKTHGGEFGRSIYKKLHDTAVRSVRRLKDFDRTQSPFAATREVSIEGCEGASIAGCCRNVKGVGDVNTVCNGRKRQLDSLRIFNLHPR